MYTVDARLLEREVLLVADAGTIALVEVAPCEDLGAFDGAGGFRKARGMRHVLELDERRNVPAENFVSVVTLVHAHDVQFGRLGLTNGMVDVALVTNGDWKDFDMFPETGAGGISIYDMYFDVR